MANESLIFDILARDGASPSLQKVGDAALEASGSLKDLSAKLKDVNGRTAAARVKLDGDKEAQHELDVMDAKLVTLGKRIANPNVKLDGVARTRADISGIDLALDRLSAKTATPDVSASGGGILGRISGLLGGGGGAASSGGGAASGGGGLLSSPAGIGGIAGGALLAAGLVPGAVGLGIGGGVGLGAIAGGLFGAAQGTKILKADTANITKITTGLKSAIGSQKAQLSAALVDANKQFAKDSNFYAPFLGFQASLKNLLQVVLTPLRGIMAPLSGIFTQFGKGLTALGPQMTAMFKASLPFIQMFATVMLQAGKILMPAFTQAMTTMVKSGALKEMTQGLVYLIQGLAGFVVALGPGMKASGQIFERICLAIKGAMIGVGVIVSVVANVLEFNFPKAIDKMRHAVSSTFDGLRHDVSSIWDTMWNNTLGRLQRGVADDQKLIANFRHNIASTFDTIRHDIAAAWDTIWNNTVARVKSGISTVVGWFHGLPGRAVSALTGLGHSLANFARSAISEMWSGFKNTFSSVIHWFEGLPKMILHALGIHSPPSWAIDAGKHIMEGLNIGLGHGLGKLTSFTTGIGAQVAAGLSGGAGGAGVARWAPIVHAALGMLGLPAGDAGVVLAQMSTESGGDPTIVNKTDSNWLAGHPSVGLMQVIRGTFDQYAGPFRNIGPFEYGVSVSPLANIYAGINYARQRYGPGWTSVLGHGHGYASGTSSAVPGWAMVGERGPELVRFGGGEQVIPNAAVGGNTYNITVHVPPSANQAEIGRHLVTAIGAFEKRSGKGWRS